MSLLAKIGRLVDSHVEVAQGGPTNVHRVDWLRMMPFAILHLGCFGVLWVGWSWTAVAVAVGLYWSRMFFITGFYHRYFSHRTFKTSRFMQALFAVAGSSAVQRGPLWWASHHRNHHIYSDKPADVHSPRQHGFWWAHIGWITSKANFTANLDRVKDFARFPELVFLDRYDTLVPFLLAVGLLTTGTVLGYAAPGLDTNGPQLLIWGFFVSSTVLLHCTLTINSLAHKIGRKRFDTGDDSRNSLPLALITMGEGWHNNHHYYPNTVRQGFYWWELDATWWMLVLLEKMGLVSDLRPIPARILERARGARPEVEAGSAGAPRTAGEVGSAITGSSLPRGPQSSAATK